MKFSVIIPSYLGPYKGAASNREEKLLRAIDSVTSQSCQDFEIIVVADGCEKTFELISHAGCMRVACYLIEKQPIWSGQVRNFGISKAKGEWVCYLDIDDYWMPDFLRTIEISSSYYDWVYFNSWQLKPKGQPAEQRIEVDKAHSGWRPGTSNFAHRRSMGIYWKDNSYSHDIRFIETLKKTSKNYGRIPNPGYMVCHIPRLVDL